jgi:hypothetical protein
MPFGREFLLERRVLEARRREYELGAAFHEPRAVRGLHEDRQVGEEQRREDEIGLRGLERGHVRGEVEAFRPWATGPRPIVCSTPNFLRSAWNAAKLLRPYE